MPIYEFKCQECGNIDERHFKLDMVKSITTGELTPRCQKCEGTTRLITSTSNFRVKGFNEKNGYSKARG